MRRTRWLVPIGAVLVSACNSAPPSPPFKAVADNKLLMQSVIDPSADVIWGAVGTIITAQGTEEILPKTDADWTTVRNSAVILAESGNLLMLVPRARDGGKWMEAAQGLINAATAAMEAAQAKNPDKLFRAGGDVYDACTTCHSRYMESIVNANKN